MNHRAFIDTDPVDHAARYRPTEDFNIRPTGEIRGGKLVRTRPELVQRRKQDARIFKDMTPAQESAFELIGYGWRAMGSDVMLKSGFDVLRVDGGRRSVNPERTAQIAKQYLDWAKTCPHHEWKDEAGKIVKGVKLNPILNIIGWAASVSATARLYKMRKADVKPNLIAGLDLYDKMHVNKRRNDQC